MKFLPSPIEWVIYILFVALFCSLGIWQLNRADEKKAIAENINHRSTESVVNLNSPFNWNQEQHQYRKAIVKGEFLLKGQLLIDNIIVKNKPGYHVITPFKIEGTDQTLLINRGWVRQEGRHRHAAKVTVPKGQVSIEGIMRTPSALPFVEASIEPLTHTESFNIWLYLDVEKYQKESSLKMMPFAILQSNDTHDGLHREWSSYQAKTGMHIGYAIQWFAFAVIVTIIFIGLGRRKAKELQINHH